jgi:hypothetical protein
MTRARDLAAFVSNADGDIKFDTDTLFIDSSANRVGIGTTTPASVLHVKGRTLAVDGAADSDSPRLNLDLDGTNKAGVRVNRVTEDLEIDVVGSNNITFDTNSNERMRIDDSGNVGIGTNSPSAALHIKTSSSANTDQLYLESTDAGSQTGPDFYIHRNSASPADNDTLGALWFVGQDDAGNAANYALLHARADDVSNGSEDGSLEFKVSVGSTLTLKAAVTQHGLALGGGTAEANSIDDYEEGTWTPDIKLVSASSTSSTYSTRSGQYTRIGNLCTVSCVIYNTAHSGTGTAYIHGLPFTHATSAESIGSAQMNTHSDSWSTNIGAINSIIQSGESTIHMRATYNTNTTGPLYIPLQNFTYLRITITYRTA